MRLDLFASAAAATNATGQINKTSNEPSGKARLASSAPTAPAEDTTTLSSTGSSVQSLTQAALQPFPTRAERVAALTQAVHSAQYQLDAARIAESLANADV